ncbi:MAG: hypothetical protein FWE57_02435 [Chitinispirillia bacterium]|nr:hypothetical protein [Chitinispirillia bacterium]
MVELLLITIVVLQIVTIFIVRGNKKQRRSSYEFKHSRNHGDGKNDRKEGDFRRGNNNKRNQHENKGGSKPAHSAAPAQQSAPAAIDPVEKSLRDINLKLKNAEREQESARKKINDYNGKEGRPQRLSNGNGVNRKNNRDRNFNRPEQRKDNWQHEKQNRADSAETSAEASHSAPEFENEKLNPVILPAVEMAVSVTESAPAPVHTDAADNRASEGDFEHGRKFVAKRRHLQESGASESESTSSENTAEASGSSEETSAEMKFGRR